jgi:hypothetical protein
MGVVHRALDLELGFQVALKAVDATRPDDLYRLKREFRLLSDIQHPNLVRLHELFVGDGFAFFTMELLFGWDFCRFIQDPARDAGHARRKALPAVCDYALLCNGAKQLASALSAVHAAGKLHRDVKPSNILVTSAGRVVLFDFGLAASMCPESAKTKSAGVLLGTRGYIAPEQARGEGLSEAADWYSFGVTLFEAATGRLPFDDGVKTFVTDRDAADLARISRLLPDVPPQLDALVASLLRPLPQHRPKEAEIFRALEDIQRSPVHRSKPPTVRPPVSAPDSNDPELAKALQRVRQGGSAILHVRGSGQAPTDLARRAVAKAERLGALVLRGKCRGEENLPFNALDEVVDDLSHVLEHMPYCELISLLPPQVAALPRLFPVLGRLETTADLIFVRGNEGDDAAMVRARAAFKDLVAGLAERRPLVIWIDSAHKGDRESGELLAHLMKPPDAQPILLVVSYQTDGDDGGTLDALASNAGIVPRFHLMAPESQTTSQGRCA